LSPAPTKPAAIDPAPVIVTVEAPTDAEPARHRNRNKNQQTRDTGRG
jgi:hypothetical protein